MTTEITQMPSKREQNKEARRNDIIEAGLLEFTAQGFTATRLDDVAARANVGKGTIYLYFASKESLFEAVVRKNLLPACERETTIAEFKGTATELLTFHIESMYTILHGENIPSLLAIIIGEMSRFPELTNFFFKELVAGGQEVMNKIIQRGIESGEFHETALKTYSQIIIAPVIFSATWKLQFDQYSLLDIEEYAKTHIDSVLLGLKT